MLRGFCVTPTFTLLYSLSYVRKKKKKDNTVQHEKEKGEGEGGEGTRYPRNSRHIRAQLEPKRRPNPEPNPRQ